MRQRVIGNEHEVRDPAPLVEGRDDTVNRRPAARGIQNTITRRNMHDGSDSFSPAIITPKTKSGLLHLRTDMRQSLYCPTLWRRLLLHPCRHLVVHYAYCRRLRENIYLE
jgi:hypothetical protein